jgi:histidinol-phosphate aminotransferase
MGRGYPPDHTAELVTAIAEVRGVQAENVVLGTGSGTILAGATRAFCSSAKPLVTAAPTYGTPETTANRIGAGVRSIPVDGSLGLDLDAMALAARGAGMVFFCNPNNPTGTAHSAADVEAFVRRVKRDSPQTAILIDEAYLDYAYDPAVRTVIPLAVELPGVFVTRSMSKAHGMAGLRVGYAIGQKETLDQIGAAWELGRDFPPLERTHSRVSLGTMAEMEASVQVFRLVVQGRTAGAWSQGLGLPIGPDIL